MKVGPQDKLAEATERGFLKNKKKVLKKGLNRNITKQLH